MRSGDPARGKPLRVDWSDIMLNNMVLPTYLMPPGDILRYPSILTALGITRGLRAGRAWNGTN